MQLYLQKKNKTEKAIRWQTKQIWFWMKSSGLETDLTRVDTASSPMSRVIYIWMNGWMDGWMGLEMIVKLIWFNAFFEYLLCASTKQLWSDSQKQIHRIKENLLIFIREQLPSEACSFVDVPTVGLADAFEQFFFFFLHSSGLDISINHWGCLLHWVSAHRHQQFIKIDLEILCSLSAVFCWLTATFVSIVHFTPEDGSSEGLWVLFAGNVLNL